MEEKEKGSVVAAETLGDVLYADPSVRVEAEEGWAGLVRQVAAHDQLALHALYERAHRFVFTLAVRITGSRESAEEVTVDVFHEARSRAIDRVRFESRKKRTEPACPMDSYAATEERDVVEVKQEGRLLRAALAVLTPHERRAIETAYFGECTYAEAAQQLNEPVGTVKTRIRSGLEKLRAVLAPEGKAR